MMHSQKNILLIFNDDHAQWASGAYGNAELHTPNIDHLAATGVRMENAFTPTPVCSPARACMLTGLLASQHGVHDYLVSAEPEIHHHDWLEGMAILPEYLKQENYQTFYSGKWHVGHDDVPHPAFDRWFTLWGDYPFEHCDLTRYSDNGAEVRLPGCTTQVITDRARDFLAQRDPARPFFLMVSWTATHSPWSGHPERLVAQYRSASFSDIPSDETYPFGEQALESITVDRTDPREALAQYYAAATHHDEALGQLLDTLDALGLRENTLVIFTSDHGLNTGHHGIWGKGNGTDPLNMVEESIRVPLVLSQPGTLAAGIRLPGFVDHTDLFRTVLEHAGISPETNRGIAFPGRSFHNSLVDPESRGKFKRIQFGEYGPLRMARTERYKLILRNPEGPHALFDLSNDPREVRNLFDLPAYAPVVDELRQEIASFFNRYSLPQHSGLLGPALRRCNTTEAWRR